MSQTVQADTKSETAYQKYFVRPFHWIFSLSPKEHRPSDPSETLARSFHITAKSRYNASIRLRRLGVFSSLTATLLSLGLILLPMLQLSGIALAYPSRVLSMLQLFLAVAVLVFSAINATAHYEARANDLNDCGDEIKALSRELRSATGKTENNVTPPDLQSFNQRYAIISTKSENHTRGDYWLAMLQANYIYNITGIPRLYLHIKTIISNLMPYVIPIVLMLLECIILLDILAVTHVLTPLFTSTANP